MCSRSKRSLTAIAIAIFCCLDTFAQKANGLIIDKPSSNEVTISTPVEANLGKFSGGSVNGFTGNSNIQIPIYEIKLKGLTIPLNLNYDNSGIKVESEASWVGLGWSLNAGGAIIRSKRGQLDDVVKDPGIINKEFGFLLDQGAAANNFTDASKTDDQIASQLAEIDGKLIYRGNNVWDVARAFGEKGRKSDTEPDLFNYSFAGRSGKFVFGNDGKIKLLSYEPYRLEYVLDNSGDYSWVNGYGNPYNTKGITSFKITDENGNVYTFSELQTSKHYGQGYRIRTFCDIDPDAPTFFGSYSQETSAWYLTKIESSQGEVVNFNYASENVKSILISTSVRNATGETPGDRHMGQYQNRDDVVNKRLTSIETPYEIITFVPGGNRLDLVGSSPLSDIQVVSKWNSTLIKQVHFTQSYFESNPYELVSGFYGSEGSALFYRLKLLEISSTYPGELVASKHSFVYNEETPLPAKRSYQQDFWGYYNRNGASNLLPKIFVSPTLYGADRFSVLQLKGLGEPNYHVLDGANRNSNPATIATGTLSKIIYPTGGSSEYEYEPHDFIYKGRGFMGGGIRVKKITDYDGISHANDIVKTYKYVNTEDLTKSSGILFNLPIFAYLENNCANELSSSGSMDQIPPAYEIDGYDYFRYNTIRMERPQGIQGFGDDISIGYSEIREEIQGLGSTVSKYSTSVPYNTLDDQVSTGCSIATEGFCNGLYATPAIKTVLAKSLDYYVPNQGANFSGVDLSPNSYPFIPNTNYDWNRGLLLNKKTYTTGNEIRSNIDYNYLSFSPETGMTVINCLFYQNGNNYNIKNTISGNTFTNWTNGLVYYNKYKIVANVNKQLSSEIRTDYLKGQMVTTTISYNYNKRKLLSSSTATNSKNETQKTTYRYPFDFQVDTYSPYGPGPSQPLSLLVYNNNIAMPIEAVSTVVGNGSELVTDVTINGYGTEYGKVIPRFVANIDLTEPLLRTNYVNAEIQWEETSEIFTMDPNMRANISYDSYDDKYNLLQVSNEGITTSYAWGYNKQYPIASATGSMYRNMLFENFEDSQGPLIANEGKTGKRSSLAGFTKDLMSDNNGTYTLSYWKKSGDEWLPVILNNIEVTNFSYRINIPTNEQVDDVRFYPQVSLMTTYTYEPSVGITSSTDPKGMTIYYEYDEFLRLKHIKDQKGNVIKSYNYHFKN